MMHRTVVALVFAGAVAANAQVPTLVPGARVRIETTQLRDRVEGTLMSQTSDSLVVASVGAVRTTLPASFVTKIKASEGKSHGAGAIRGIKIGAIIGGAVGLLVAAAYHEDYSTTTGTDQSNELLAFAALEAAGGAIWGAAIGGIVGTEKWTTVYEAPVRFGMGRGINGAPVVGLAIRF